MLSTTVEKYIASAKGLPFFYAVGEDEYLVVLSELKQHGFIVDRVSDFCPKDDKVPNIDEIVDHFRTLDVDYQKNRRVLIGLGEYLSLRGDSYITKELQRLKNTTLGNARVIILLRCVTQHVRKMIQEDSRIAAQQRVQIGSDCNNTLAITSTSLQLLEGALKGIKGFLQACEDGLVGKCSLCSTLTFPNSIIPITTITSIYAALRQALPSLCLMEKLGNEDQWSHLYHDLMKKEFSLAQLFEHYGYTFDFETDLYNNCAGYEYRNWLYFIFLKVNQDSIPNVYLKYVVGLTESFDELHNKLLTEIIHIPRSSENFHEYYSDRKRLIRSFPESDIAIFVHENSIDPTESIYRYTDNTQLEREGIIRWVSKYGYIKDIANIYPALAQYLESYTFDCGKLSDELTTYFTEYKLQKVTNRIYPDFLDRVVANVHKLKYMHLEKRESALLRIPDKHSAYLYWIDALGVEYLSYITYLAKARGLTARIDITYAELPTITAINKGFFDKWSGPQKYKESELDEIKHKEKGGFVFKDGEGPIHLASELKVIERAIDRAATELAMHSCKTFIITSDHGASRLAVIHKQEEKYATDTIGEHSGRCCKVFEQADLPNAIEENGYLVLGDYGRFKGSRAANVEVHGGATLEEVLVPVVSLTLRRQTDIVIKLLNSDEIYADRHAGTVLNMYISDVENTNKISITIGTNRYIAKQVDSTHYTIVLADVKRSKKGNMASVYDGDDLIGSVTFDIKGKTAIVKSDFDDLF